MPDPEASSQKKKKNQDHPKPQLMSMGVEFWRVLGFSFAENWSEWDAGIFHSWRLRMECQDKRLLYEDDGGKWGFPDLLCPCSGGYPSKNSHLEPWDFLISAGRWRMNWICTGGLDSLGCRRDSRWIGGDPTGCASDFRVIFPFFWCSDRAGMRKSLEIPPEVENNPW